MVEQNPRNLIGKEITIVWWRRKGDGLMVKYRDGFKTIVHDMYVTNWHLMALMKGRIPRAMTIEPCSCGRPGCLTASNVHRVQ